MLKNVRHVFEMALGKYAGGTHPGSNIVQKVLVPVIGLIVIILATTVITVFHFAHSERDNFSRREDIDHTHPYDKGI